MRLACVLGPVHGETVDCKAINDPRDLISRDLGAKSRIESPEYRSVSATFVFPTVD